jgi:hypothetical protein
MASASIVEDPAPSHVDTFLSSAIPDTPGPGEYDPILNDVTLKFSFGGKGISRHGRASPTPGPGAYRNPRAFGKQADSLRRSGSEIKFGTSTRDDINKVIVQASPGPAAYSHEAPHLGTSDGYAFGPDMVFFFRFTFLPYR